MTRFAQSHIKSPAVNCVRCRCAHVQLDKYSVPSETFRCKSQAKSVGYQIALLVFAMICFPILLLLPYSITCEANLSRRIKQF